jgi:2-epi-5-epi-valiolone epimerase
MTEIAASYELATPAVPRAVGIPTARNVDHVAFTVPALSTAVDFFTSVLGAELVYRLGPVEDPHGDWMTRKLGVDPRASADIAMLRLGPVTNVELFEYRAPGQVRTVPRNSDVGGHHLAFYVDDVDAAVDYLRSQPGIRVLGEPQTMPADTPNAGDRWIYFLTPWGMQMEVHNVPVGMPYEKTTDCRRFGPCADWAGSPDHAAPPRPTPRGIPTVRNVDHFAVTVRDLDEAVEFFTSVIGAELLYTLGPLNLDADFMATQLNVPNAGILRQALLRLGL